MRNDLNIPFLAAVIFLALLTGCSNRPALEEMNPDQAFQYLKGIYNQGDYLNAANGFDFFTLNYSGSSLVDSAQFMLGQAHIKLKEYLLAANAFEELTRRFPRSPLVPDAMYMIGVCYWKLSPKYPLDQEYTDRALDALQAFIDYFPDYTERVRDAQELIEACRDKLAHKEYASGLIYFKMKSYQSAVIYFQDLLDTFYDTAWAPLAAYKLGASYAGDEQFENAYEAYRAFISKYPDHPWRSRAESEMKDLSRKIEKTDWNE
ncbi:MAG TPA: outer membrane protein assembly factor BamD [Bacteroidetes bacterium]|nr:outer membrane protein assembly factor BamD [Bacteroidota bacterium]